MRMRRKRKGVLELLNKNYLKRRKLHPTRYQAPLYYHSTTKTAGATQHRLLPILCLKSLTLSHINPNGNLISRHPSIPINSTSCFKTKLKLTSTYPSFYFSFFLVMATCFGPLCIMWQPPDSVPGDPPPSHVFFIGFRVGDVVENHWLEQPATVLLCDGDPVVPLRIESFAVKGDELLTSENLAFANLSGMHSLVVPVTHSKAVAMAYETTDNGRNVTAVVEIPFLWFCAPQEVQQNREEDDEDEDEDEFEDGENETMDDVVSYSLDDGMDMDVDVDVDVEVEVEVEVEVDVDVDVDMVVPATKASIEALEKFKLEGLDSMDKCMICLEQLSMEAEVSRMPCSHVYHGDCIIQWLKKSHMCPLCRFKMPVEPS